jgi:transposase-like protein
MIITQTIHNCSNCQSTNIVKNGKNISGNQQYRCKDCGSCRVLSPKTTYSVAEKEQIMNTYKERCSLRGTARIYGLSRTTLTRWLKKS